MCLYRTYSYYIQATASANGSRNCVHVPLYSAPAPPRTCYFNTKFEVTLFEIFIISTCRRSRCQVPLPGPAARSRCQVPLPDPAARSRCQIPLPGPAARSRCQIPLPDPAANPVPRLACNMGIFNTGSCLQYGGTWPHPMQAGCATYGHVPPYCMHDPGPARCHRIACMIPDLYPGSSHDRGTSRHHMPQERYWRAGTNPWRAKSYLQTTVSAFTIRHGLHEPDMHAQARGVSSAGKLSPTIRLCRYARLDGVLRNKEHGRGANNETWCRGS